MEKQTPGISGHIFRNAILNSYLKDLWGFTTIFSYYLKEELNGRENMHDLPDLNYISILFTEMGRIMRISSIALLLRMCPVGEGSIPKLTEDLLRKEMEVDVWEAKITGLHSHILHSHVQTLPNEVPEIWNQVFWILTMALLPSMWY